MSPLLTDTLCTNCGLCCDGTLFADVELVGQAEIARLRSELEGLRATVTEMGRTVETLSGQMREVRQGLGM